MPTGGHAATIRGQWPDSGRHLTGEFRLHLTAWAVATFLPPPAAYLLNVTVVPQGPLGYLTIWPNGEARPITSTLNSDGRVKANAAIVVAGSQGTVSVYVTNTTNLVLDISGYFQPATASTLVFYPLKPCRVADTRNTNGPLGGPHLTANQERNFPVLDASACDIPSSAKAYSLNFTVVPRSDPVETFTAWPYGQPKPVSSTLNAPTGTIVANAAIVSAGTSGEIATWATNDTDLVIDINGYFASAGTGGHNVVVSGRTLPRDRHA